MGAVRGTRAHALVAAAVVGACAAAGAAQPAEGGPPDVLAGPYGSGAAAVWMLVPRARPRSAVVFLHGWKATPRSSGSAWVAQFRPWLDHLASRGSVVLFPAYQTGGDGQGPGRVASLRRGLETGLARLRLDRLPLVAAGYSYGASLAFAYAANARAWGLPQPRAVDAVFPAAPVAGAPLPPLGRSVEVVIEVGDRDTVAGRSGADAFWSWLGGRGRARRLVVVRSHGSFVADHAAPKLTSAAARRAFWEPLDALVSRASAS